MNEIWKDAPGWEGLYQVSNWGRVKRLAGSPKCKRDRMLKQQPDKDGYSHLTFSKNGILTNVKVHRLVMESFVGTSDLEVNHIDGNKANNRLGNLEYMTRLENQGHALETGLSQNYGSRNNFAKLTEPIVIEIKKAINSGLSHKHVANQFGVPRRTITHIATGHTWRRVQI